MEVFKKKKAFGVDDQGQPKPQGVWDKMTAYFKTRQPTTKVTNDPNALAEVSKSFKRVR